MVTDIGEPSDEPGEREVADHGDRGIGRRGLVGGVIGAVALGAVGVGVAKVLDDDRDRDGDGDGEPAAPPPAEPDDPPVQLGPAVPGTTTEHRRGASVEPGSPLARLHDLRVASEVVEDFALVAPTASAPFGWTLLAGGPGAASFRPPLNEGGAIRLRTGSAATGRVGLHLGLETLAGLPVFTMEWRLGFSGPADATVAGGAVFGYLDSVSGGGTLPATGVYFVHRSDLSPRWLCVCANAEGRSVQESAVVADRSAHRFTITGDGAGLARFYVDDDRVATIDTTLPTGDDRYGPGIEVFRSSGGDEQFDVDVDWFYVRRELAR